MGRGWTVDRSGRLVYNARQAVAGAPWCDDLIIAGDHRQGAAYIGIEAHAALAALITEAADRARDLQVLAAVGRMYLDALDDDPDNEMLTASEVFRVTEVRDAVARAEGA